MINVVCLSVGQQHSSKTAPPAVEKGLRTMRPKAGEQWQVRNSQ